MREKVELLGGAIYWSDDDWATIWRHYRRPAGRYGVRHEDVPQRVTDKHEADRVRYIAVVQYGGGRNDN